MHCLHERFTPANGSPKQLWIHPGPMARICSVNSQAGGPLPNWTPPKLLDVIGTEPNAYLEHLQKADMYAL